MQKYFFFLFKNKYIGFYFFREVHRIYIAATLKEKTTTSKQQNDDYF